MWSKNKRAPRKDEHEHIERIKGMACAVCEASGPSDAHEIRQGDWWTAVPLCKDCHQGPLLGIHGQRAAWNLRKMDELDALSNTVRELLT